MGMKIDLFVTARVRDKQLATARRRTALAGEWTRPHESPRRGLAGDSCFLGVYRCRLVAFSPSKAESAVALGAAPGPWKIAAKSGNVHISAASKVCESPFHLSANSSELAHTPSCNILDDLAWTSSSFVALKITHLRLPPFHLARSYCCYHFFFSPIPVISLALCVRYETSGKGQRSHWRLAGCGRKNSQICVRYCQAYSSPSHYRPATTCRLFLPSLS